MAATIDSLDLLGTDLAHRRLKTRPAAPLAPPPRAAERLPAARPATAEMEAPVWPGVEPAPPVRARTNEPPLTRQDVPPMAARVTTSPPVPARLAAASVVPRQIPVEVVTPPPAPTAATPPIAPKAVAPEPAPEPQAPEPLFDGATEAWFAQDPVAEAYADPYFDERPAGLPWWAVAIPASAALGVVAMVLTALALVATRV